jgi:hypothetical protein
MGILKTMGPTGRFAADDEPGRDFAQGPQNAPKEFLAHRRGTNLVGVGKTVATGSSRAADGHQGPLIELQRITDVIEADRMRHLRMQERNDMAPVGEIARLFSGTALTRQLGNQIAQNELQICLKMVNFEPVGLCFLFSHPPCGR